MAREKKRKIAAIIPAYNEARRISPVLQTLRDSKEFSEVIVVDDGSTDETGEIARALGARVIRNKKNMGKGFSMERAVKHTGAAILFFCDADVLGLSPSVIRDIITPVKKRDVDMFIGMRNRKIYFTHKIFMLVPLLGGERACTRELWEEIPSEYKEGFKVESALNFYGCRNGKKYDFKVFQGLSQTIKEKKYGLMKGFIWRLTMFGEIIAANWKLHKGYFSSLFRDKLKITQ